MDKYEQLRRVVQAANPEIMELKFGCEIHVLFDANSTDRQVIGVNDNRTARTKTYSELNLQDIKILGRPIRLADVLLAMRENNRGQFYFRDDGVLFEWDKFDGAKNHSVKPTYIEWNLKDDNLDHQSEETKQFLINLLVN